MYNFKAIFGANSKLLNLNQKHPTKKTFFWSNTHKIVLMITSLIKMRYQTSYQMSYQTLVTWPHLQHLCHEMKFFGHLIDRNYGFIVFSKYLYFKKVGSIAGIIKIVTMSIKTTFKTYLWQILGRVRKSFFASPIREQPLKSSCWIVLIMHLTKPWKYKANINHKQCLLDVREEGEHNRIINDSPLTDCGAS